MKQKIVYGLIVSIILTTGIFANPIDDNVGGNVWSSFNQRFNGATSISWSKTSKYVKASFNLHGQVMFAYFTRQGEFIGVTRNILSNQLPINFQDELKRISRNNWISELFELASKEQTTYYVTIENAHSKIYLNSDPDHSWSIIKKTKKV